VDGASAAVTNRCEHFPTLQKENYRLKYALDDGTLALSFVSSWSPAEERRFALSVTVHLWRSFWADQFDEAGAGVLVLQDQVIQKIVQSLIGKQCVIRADESAPILG